MGVLYIKWLGLTTEKFSAVNSDKLVILGSTPQDMQWAETCQAKYLAVHGICLSMLNHINCRRMRVKNVEENNLLKEIKFQHKQFSPILRLFGKTS